MSKHLFKEDPEYEEIEDIDCDGYDEDDQDDGKVK